MTTVISLAETDKSAMLAVYDSTTETYTGYLGTYANKSRAVSAVSSGEYTVSVSKKASSKTIDDLETASYEPLTKPVAITVKTAENKQIAIKVESKEIAEELKLPEATASENGMHLEKGDIKTEDILSSYNGLNLTVEKGILKAEATEDGVKLSIDTAKFPAIALGNIGLRVNNQYIAGRSGYKEWAKELDTKEYLFPFVEKGKTYNFWLFTEHQYNDSVPIKSDIVEVTAKGGLGEAICNESFRAEYDSSTHDITITEISTPKFLSSIDGNSRYEIKKVLQIHHPKQPGEWTTYIGENVLTDNKTNLAQLATKQWENCCAVFKYRINDNIDEICWESGSISSSNLFTFGKNSDASTVKEPTLIFIFGYKYLDVKKNGGNIITIYDDGTTNFYWREYDNDTKTKVGDWQYKGKVTKENDGSILIDENEDRKLIFKPETDENGFAILKCTGYKGKEPDSPTTGLVYKDYLHESKLEDLEQALEQ